MRQVYNAMGAGFAELCIIPMVGRRRSKTSVWSMFVGMFMFLALSASIAAGIAIVLGYTARPRFFGWSLFLTATIAAVFTVDRWAKGLGILFGTAGLNGLIILVTGHALNNPAIPLPPVKGFGFFLVGTAASILTARVSSTVGSLTRLVRAGCLGILVCTVFMITCIQTSVQHWETPVSIAFIICLATLGAGTNRTLISKHTKLGE